MSVSDAYAPCAFHKASRVIARGARQGGSYHNLNSDRTLRFISVFIGTRDAFERFRGGASTNGGMDLASYKTTGVASCDPSEAASTI